MRIASTPLFDPNDKSREEGLVLIAAIVPSSTTEICCDHDDGE
jgi:hypothetical protein